MRPLRSSSATMRSSSGCVGCKHLFNFHNQMNEQNRETNISSLSKRLVVNVRFDNIEIPPVQVSSCVEAVFFNIEL